MERQRALLRMLHIGCEYVGSRYRMTQDHGWCAACGRPTATTSCRVD